MIRAPARNLALACSVLLLACGGGTDETMQEEVPPAETTAAEPPSPLAAFAGTWSVVGRNEAGDSLASYELVATGTTEGWTATFPGRDPIPVRVIEAAGDSVVTEMGPYESVLRPGVQVTLTSVTRVQGDQIMATAVARYAGAGADSVLNIRSTGTRIR